MTETNPKETQMDSLLDCSRCGLRYGPLYAVQSRGPIPRRVFDVIAFDTSRSEDRGPYCAGCARSRIKELRSQDLRSWKRTLSEETLENVERDDCCLVSVQAAGKALGKRIARSRVNKVAHAAGYRPGKSGMYRDQHHRLIRECGLTIESPATTTSRIVSGRGINETTARGFLRGVHDGVYIFVARSKSGGQHAFTANAGTKETWNTSATWLSADLVEIIPVTL